MNRYEIALKKSPPLPDPNGYKTITEILENYGFTNIIENINHTFNMTRYDQQYRDLRLENPEDAALLSEEDVNRWQLNIDSISTAEDFSTGTFKFVKQTWPDMKLH